MTPELFELGEQFSLPERFTPKEPLFSLLVDSPKESLEFMLNNLIDIDSKDQLNEIEPSVGIPRIELIHHVHFVLTRYK